MSWSDHLKSMLDDEVIGAALWGIDPPSFWGATDELANITVDEVQNVVSKHQEFQTNGPHINGKKCHLLRNNLNDEVFMNLDMKMVLSDGQTCSLCIGKANKTLLFFIGPKGSRAGTLGDKMYKRIKWLISLGH